MTKYIACRSLDSSRRRSRISSIREEYCIYIDDDEYGYYLPNGSKTSMPFGMLVQQILGEQGQIKLRIAKQLLDDVPAIRYTITTFDPNQSNPDTLFQGGSSAADVFPGTNEVFEGEINGYGEISSSGIGISKSYTIYYVYDGINPIIEYSPNGSILKKYVYAGGRHIAKIAGADTHYYHCDALGSPRRVTNENGSSKWMTRYYPFGEMFTTMGSGNTHTFTGKEWDSEMSLNYFCQRYYDPEIGRFMTLDPFSGYLGLPQSQNRYSYCINNPLKYIDPLGLGNHPPLFWLPIYPEDYMNFLWTESGIPQGLGYYGGRAITGIEGGIGTAIDVWEYVRRVPPIPESMIYSGAFLAKYAPSRWLKVIGGLALVSGTIMLGQNVDEALQEIIEGMTLGPVYKFKPPPETPKTFKPNIRKAKRRTKDRRSHGRKSNYPYPISPDDNTWYHLKDEIWHPNHQGASHHHQHHQHQHYYEPEIS